ncbi:hypothetical protein KP509_12G064100 [Ceratopteris richardii]|nr:hypothetical protein KP509_12G064100 [Ceratopteris richardii]
MNVGLGGHGSREKIPKSVSKLKGSEESISPGPGVVLGDITAEDTLVNGDALVSSTASKDRKSLDHRYTELVINAINELKDPNGCGTTAIASFIESHHPVPSNFRRLLSSKLRDMVSQGNLLKIKQNYKINTIDPPFLNEGMLAQGQHGRIYQGVGRGHDYDSAIAIPHDAGNLDMAKRKFVGRPPSRFDVDLVKLKTKTAQEAAQAAAIAVAEAEAAAAAAEKASKEAEAAEAEADAAEFAVELATLAVKNSKRMCGPSLHIDDVAIAV